MWPVVAAICLEPSSAIGGDFSPRLNGGPFDGSGTAVVPGQFTDFRSNGDFGFHTATAKLSYRFN
ncbi:hypothetical protein [Aureimonas sp. ME7]|uniref:hypothetical protein n=1 Tax=Aureimonas sp. ME7 TaxID=2744252 RepID=UPI0015FBDF23|nr:hypothetical protein [Aureimonas sp. ME7]